MYTINLDLEVISPLFMSGAERNKCELRLPEFKGMLRFWWRAMRALGDWQNMLEREEKIFGGTKKVKQKSQVRLRITDYNNLHYKDMLELDRNSHQGVLYLLHFASISKRPFIEPGSSFCFTLSAKEYGAFLHGAAALWLALYLGGFGARARRGGGNLAVKNVNIEPLETLSDLPDFLPGSFKGVEGLKKWLEDQVVRAKEIICVNSALAGENHELPYSNLKGARLVIPEIGEKLIDWREPMELIGKKMMNFRRKKHPDYQIFVDFLLGNPVKGKELERVLFGLPLGGRFNQNPAVKGRSFRVEPASQEYDRRASPLIIKLLRINGVFFPMLVYLKGLFLRDQFLKMRETIKKGKEEKAEKARPQYVQYTRRDIIGEFIQEAFPERAEVFL